MQKKNFLIIISIIFVNSLLFAEKESVFKKIEYDYLTSFKKPTFTAKEIKIIQDKDNPNYKENINKILEKKKANTKSKKIILNLLNEHKLSKQQIRKHSTKKILISNVLWKDLELLCGEHTPSSHLLSKISKTKTHCGTIMLAKRLVEPILDVEELISRQNITKEIIENEKIFDQLNSTIKEYSKIEDELLNFWDNQSFRCLFGDEFYFPPYPLDLLPKKFLNSIFPQNRIDNWNQNSLALEGLTIFNNLNAFRRIANEFTMVPLHMEQIGKILFPRTSMIIADDSKRSYAQKIADYVNKYTIELLKHYTIDQIAKMCPETIKTILGGLWKTEQVLWNLARIPITLLEISKSIGYEAKKITTLKVAHSRLRKAAFAIKSAINLKQIIDTNPILKEEVTFFKNINYLFDDSSSGSKEFDILLQYLTSKNFNNPNKFSILFSRGQILAASYLMVKNQDKLVDILKTIGKMDAYLSVAKLHLESKDNHASYCFAQYLENDSPMINIKEFWTPFINHEIVVTNSIKLGHPNKEQNVIISGPNAGGKSTTLKSILTNILLAQTIGIAPAKSLKLTPFLYIDSYLNITDNISDKKSSFKSECLRVNDLLKTINYVNKIGFSFVIMDEIFSKTNPIVGEALGYAIGKYLAGRTKNIAMVASHYPKMTNLEKDTDGLFKNYKVTVNKNDDGSLSYPFKLKEGKTNQTVAINILENILKEEEWFDEQIIDDANSIINELGLGL